MHVQRTSGGIATTAASVLRSTLKPMSLRSATIWFSTFAVPCLSRATPASTATHASVVRSQVRALLALLCLAPLAAHSSDRLAGVWRSDEKESMDFVRTHTLLEPRQTDFLAGLLGRLELTFDGAHMRYRMPDADIPIQGKSQHFAGFDEKFGYRVLGSDNDSVALLIAKVHGQDRIWHLHFVSDDMFWIYSEDGDYGLRDLNFREYFRRVR